MKFKWKPLHIVSFSAMFILIFVVLALVLGSLRQTLSSLESQVVSVLEEKLKTKVEIAKVEGDFVKKLILKDVVLYDQFRRDLILAKAQAVIIEFDMVKALLKEKVPIRNIKKITVENCDLYMDENFGQLEAVKIIAGIDDGLEDGPKNLIVDIKDGRVHSRFQAAKYGKFRADHVRVRFNVIPKGLSFEGFGYLKGDDKIYQGTQTPFHIYGDDSVEKGTMRGTLDLKSLNYLNYKFKSIAFDYAITSEKIKFHVEPSQYEPFIRALPGAYVESYHSANKYNYLIDLSFEYLIDEEDIYLEIPVTEKSEAVKAIVKDYLSHSDFSNYLSRLNKNFDWQPYGKALFRFNRGDLTDFDLHINRVDNVIQPKDKLSFRLSMSESADNPKHRRIVMEKIHYDSPKGGSIKGAVSFSLNQDFKSLNLDIDKLNIPAFFPDRSRGAWAFSRKKRDSPINIKKKDPKESLLEKIDLNQDTITTRLTIHKLKDAYEFSLQNNKLASKSIPNADGKVWTSGGRIGIELRGEEKVKYHVTASIDPLKPDEVDFDLKLGRLNYPLLKEVLALEPDLGEIAFKGDLKGKINLKDLIRSTASGQFKVVSMGSSEKGTGQSPPGASIDPNIKDLATVNVKYKNSTLYFDDSYFHEKDIKFKGLISFQNGTIYPEFTIKYLEIPIYIDGAVSEVNGRYHTKINLVYDDFNRQWTAFDGYLSLKDHKIHFGEAILRHHQKPYHVRGTIGWKDSQFSTDLALIPKTFDSPPKSQDNLYLKGVIGFSKHQKRKTIFPQITLTHHNTPYTLKGQIVLEKHKILPQLTLAWTPPLGKQNKFAVKGSMDNRKNGMDADLDFSYNKSNFNLTASIRQKKKGVHLNLLLNGLGVPMGLEGLVFSDPKGGVRTQMALSMGERLIEIDGRFSKKGNTIYSNVFFKSDEHRAHLNGYVAYADRYYFPYYKLTYSSPATDYKFMPFILEGQITEYDRYFDIDTVINKRLNITGQYKKYSLLSLKVFFDDFIVSTPDQKTSFTLFNKYDQEGIVIKVSGKGIQTKGEIGLKGFSFLPDSSIVLETQFSHHIPFNQSFSKQFKKIVFHSMIISKNKKPILVSSGGLSVIGDIWSLSLNDKKGKTSLAVQYDAKRQRIDSRLRFNKFSLNNFSPSLRGELSGELFLRGPTNNPDILSSGLIIEKGSLDGQPFSGNFSLSKKDNVISMPTAFFSLNNMALQLKNMKYTLPRIPATISEYFTELKANGVITIENLVFWYNKAKFDLRDVKYRVGDKSIRLAKFNKLKPSIVSKSDKSLQIKSQPQIAQTFSPTIFVTNPNSEFTFRKGNIKVGHRHFFEVDRFKYRAGSHWHIDFDIKAKSIFLGNQYLAEFSIFGGRQGKKAEINLIGRRITSNYKKYKDIELVMEARDNRWTLWPNRLNLKGSLLWVDDFLSYHFNYSGETTSLVTKGEVYFKDKTIDLTLSMKDDNLALSQVAPIVFKEAEGQLKSNVRLFGNWNNPKLEGSFKLSNGSILLLDHVEPIDDIDIQVTMNRDKVYEKDKFQFSHHVKVSADYNDGKGVFEGYFNFNRWSITEFDSNLTTPKKMKITNKNNIFEYDGYVRTNLRFRGTAKEKVLSGQIYLSDGRVTYMGKKTIQSSKKTFFTTIQLDTVDIIVEEDVIANVGQGRLSFGEVILKPYNEETKEGTKLVLKKKGSGQEEDSVKLKGQIQARKGEFDYLGHTFRIIEAEIAFSENEEPKIIVKARANDVRDESNRSVTVFLKVKETLTNLFKQGSTAIPGQENILLASLSSSPSKSPQEIALLLGVKDGSEERDLSGRSQSRTAAGKTANVALNLALIKPIERKLKETFGIDTFNIKQQFLQNTIFRESPSQQAAGAGPTSQGSEINFLRNTEITLGKYITNDIFLNVGLLLQQDTSPARQNDTKKVWKAGVSLDVLPFIGVESERVKIQLGVEGFLKPDEPIPGNRREGIIKIEFNIEF